MSSGRCADCRHWSASPNPDPRYYSSEHRRCEKMPNTSDIWKIDGEYDEQGEETGDAAKARDKFAGPYCGDLSGCGTFMTPPAFGCVLYEPGNAVRMVAK